MRRLRRRRPKPSAAGLAYARAASAAAATPWREASFAVVDLEMTGLDHRRDEIISFASVPIEGGRVRAGKTQAAIVRPERMPTATTIRIHGLRAADLAAAPPLAEALDFILEALTGQILVAHAAWVERMFLAPALRTAGVQLREPVLCTARIAAHLLIPSERPGSAEIPLAEAAERLNLPVHRPHEAAGDALTTAQLFLALATRLERRSPQTVGTLEKLSGA